MGLSEQQQRRNVDSRVFEGAASQRFDRSGALGHGFPSVRLSEAVARLVFDLFLLSGGVNMHYKLVDEKPKTFVLVFETNDELAQSLKKFASEQKLASASFKAIGALSSLKLGWLNWQTKQYEPSVSLDEQVELLSLIGDVALKDGEPQVHAHAVVGKRDGTAHGGHLLQAYVRPTCELVLTESPTHLNKEFDHAAGIALIKL